MRIFETSEPVCPSDSRIGHALGPASAEPSPPVNSFGILPPDAQVTRGEGTAAMVPPAPTATSSLQLVDEFSLRATLVDYPHLTGGCVHNMSAVTASALGGESPGRDLETGTRCVCRSGNR